MSGDSAPGNIAADTEDRTDQVEEIRGEASAPVAQRPSIFETISARRFDSAVRSNRKRSDSLLFLFVGRKQAAQSQGTDPQNPATVAATQKQKMTKTKAREEVKRTVKAMNEGSESFYFLKPVYDWQAETSGGQRPDLATRKLEGFSYSVSN